MRETIPTERDQLNLIRLTRDLTVRELAADIGITEANLRRLLNVTQVVVNDRTAYRIRQYLKRATNDQEAA